MLKKLGVSASGYKAWKRRQPSNTELRRNRVKEDIVDIYNGSHQNYGAPKITAELRKNGETIADPNLLPKPYAKNLRKIHICKLLLDFLHGF